MPARVPSYPHDNRLAAQGTTGAPYRDQSGAFNRYLTNVAEGGLVRRSGPGSGKAAVHLGAVEIANLLLALAAPHPNEAAKAAKALGDLFPEGPQEGDSSLRTNLAGTIEIMAMRLQHGSSDFGDADWELISCLNPLRATMTWPSRGPEAIRRYLPYVDAKTIAPAMRPAPPFRREFGPDPTAADRRGQALRRPERKRRPSQGGRRH